MSFPDLLAALDASTVAEVGYRDADGRPSATALVPLVADGAITFALPYAQHALAAALAASETVSVVASDARLGLRGWGPQAGSGRVELLTDPEGEVFADGLLEQELRKHPPARLLADSLVLRREHWWYLPRLLLRIRPAEAWPVGKRTVPDQGVLCWWEGGPRADTVAAVERDDDGLELISLAGALLPGRGSACLLRHDRSVPDMEQQSQLLERGALDDGVLRVEDRQGALGLPGPAGLLTRYRNARALERACRRGLATLPPGSGA